MASTEILFCLADAKAFDVSDVSTLSSCSSSAQSGEVSWDFGDLKEGFLPSSTSPAMVPHAFYLDSIISITCRQCILYYCLYCYCMVQVDDYLYRRLGVETALPLSNIPAVSHTNYAKDVETGGTLLPESLSLH